ncbi:MAG: metal-dependent hydrolase [Nitrososphaerales archaeon]
MEPLIHFIIPFTALTLLNVRVKKALLISLLAILPDLDAIFLIHRSFSHSIIIILIVITLLLPLMKKLKIHGYALLVTLSLVSHPILDLFSGYTPILWPFYSYSIWIQAELMVHIASSPSFALSMKLLEKPTIFQQLSSLDAPLFTSEGIILSIVLIMPIMMRIFIARYRDFTNESYKING